MIKITSMPKDTLAEMVLFIAENERFSSVREHLGDSFTVPQVRAALRELACGLMEEAVCEGAAGAREARTDSELSSRARDIISSLSPAEERKLLTAFGLVSK